MNIKLLYGDKITELLKKHLEKKEPLSKSGFFLFKILEENTILFIGINPSNVKNIHEYSMDKENGVYWGKEEFKKEYSRFYKPFDKLACGMKWSHLDLFFSLETNLKEIKKMKNKEFLVEQFNISTEIIKKLEPKIIVVGNAFASDLIKDTFNCNFNNEIGTYRIKEINNIPIFFSGMFSGQHSLDKGNMKRLIWHIEFVKEKLKI